MQFGPYTVQRPVEQRGGLTVYAAKHNTTGEIALLTVYKPDSLDSAYRWTERLNQLQRLKHPSITTPVEVSRTMDGVPFVMSPLIVPLLGRNKVLSFSQTAEVVKQIGAALDYAHDLSITHGMLRATHIGLVGGNRFVLRGFELAGGDGMPHNPQQDIAALGQFVQRALVGQNVSGGHIAAVLPAEVAEVVAVSQEAYGYASAGEFSQALTTAISHLPGSKRGSALVNRPPAVRKRGGLARTLILILLLVIVGLGIFGYFQYINGALPFLRPPAQLADLPTAAGLSTDVPTLLAQAANTLLPSPATNTPVNQPTQTPLDAVPTTALTITTVGPTPKLPGAITATPFFIPSDTPPPLSPTATTFEAVPSAIPSDTAIAPGPTFEVNASPDASLPIGPTTMPAPPKPCISLVGDSVTHGGVTYNIPDTGYIIGLTRPLADFVNDKLREQGINDLIAYDRGVSNTGINTSNHPSYFRSSAYSLLLDDHCKFTILMPWYNDITPDRVPQADAAPQHVRAIIALARKLVEQNPGGRVIVMNYYTGAVAPFAAATWAQGFTPGNRDLYNREIKLSCDIGSLSKISQVTCFNTDDAFQAVGTDYVIGMATREDVLGALVAPIGDIQQSWLDEYNVNSPGGLLEGDGIHLSKVGKEALGTYIVQITRSLPDLPMP